MASYGRYKRLTWFMVFFIFYGASVAFAAVPTTINYQGQLTDNHGDTVPNGSYDMRFYLYDFGGTLQWDEQHEVVVTDGIYNIQLGDVNPLDADVFAGGEVYLGVEVYHTDTSTWEMLSPRQPLTSTAYAFQAENAVTLAGQAAADFSPSVHEHSGGDITTGTVDEARIDPDIARDVEISWGNLSGIPSDIADGDQVSISSETDPTITNPSVKDGVSWGELSGIPTGFADGTDNVGLTEGSDYGRSGVSSTLYEGTTALTNKYVGKSGAQTMTNGSLTVNTTYGIGNASVTGVKGSAQSDTFGFGIIGEATGSQGYGVYGGASGETGIGLYGEATGTYGRGMHGVTSGTHGWGVYGESSGTSGRGVYGKSSNTEATISYGGYFLSNGPLGRGVFGGAPNASETINYGGYFTASGTTGRGVYGIALNTEDSTNYGGYFTAFGLTGRGVYGEATGTEGTGVYGEAPLYGVHGRTWSTNGRGVYGEATGATGSAVHGWAGNTGDVLNYGGHFTARGSYGRGVYGEAVNEGDSTNHGGFFTAGGSTGRGVYGGASGASGRGVYGKATNTGDVENYGGYFVAEGRDGMGVYAEATGLSGHAVYGHATNTEASFNHGGIFKANGIQGIGVIGEAMNQGDHQNWGGHFTAHGSLGIGVSSSGQLYDFKAGGPGINYGSFTGAHDVRLAEDMPNEIRPGMIVSVSGRVEARTKDDGEISLSSTLPTVTLAKKAMDKAVFGVFVIEAPLGKDYWHETQQGDRFGAVNALGEGRVWVTNITGRIVAGDYITSSAIPGYGQKQDDDLLHSYTLGKAIETVDWDVVEETLEYDGKTYKVYLIAVVYTSG